MIGSPYAGELPNLYPWVPVTIENDVAVDWEGDPCYYKIDPAGNQLPHMDKIHIELSGRDIDAVNMKIIAGEVAHIAEELPLENNPFYKVMLLPYRRSFLNLAWMAFVVPDDPMPDRNSSIISTGAPLHDVPRRVLCVQRG